MSKPPARLDSLLTKLAKPGLKFKPKLVVRKTQEELDALAPTIKQEPKRPRPRTKSTRGRGGMRGGRQAPDGTHVVSTGPLALLEVTSLSLRQARESYRSLLPPSEYISGLRLKQEEDDDSLDATRIDMSQEYRFDERETTHFPVRLLPLAESGSATPEHVRLLLLPEPDVRGETQPGIVQLQLAEETQTATDYRTMVDEFARLLLQDPGTMSREYLLFQLPKQLPEFEFEKEEEGQELPTGEVGQLRVHKSGKVTMKIGNVVMDVSRGAQLQFLQDVVLVNRNENEQRVYLMGHATEKMVAVPQCDV